ncbi:hypothetical protein C1Y08_18950 [Pseudomonas sp. FW306-02-F02-AA]|nr:hypothetical protein C1Y07_28270 [Pseudomonas sp. FW306-02-F02-AB]PMZ06692.1 hypothetical protein C1Y06_28530 [Pseudomonas sp. FW306-02-H06C]PMZ14290.1 hypothetical protein C1Y08_18950 [Pseudomonas sp. FW306-02-F02-AA]PMZ18501.1 hypothetical protein C1Y09_29010 [Pseudomonas sp. FW306-02-F08-AA]PMZ24468.1 hypothetical protein C1Y05_28685 [Pseudomonas sp. FW306-02-F04-BA]PMZ33646.1 hypothetical protein C1X99_15630 [Pseudomonas sp. FW306-02-H06B]PMZ38122.1 hypothetical protein C1Y00_23590 [Ps
MQVYISIPAVTAACGFALTATPFGRRPKGSKGLRPKRTAPRLGSAFPHSGVHQGASPTVCCATTSSRCVRLRRTALRANPLMNTSTRPPEGAVDQKQSTAACRPA